MKQTKKTNSSTERPVGVTILAVLGYIGAILMLLLGLLFLIGSSAITSIIATVAPEIANYSSLGTMVVIVIGIVLLGFAVLYYYIARGLWNGRNWARIVMLVFSTLSVISSLWPFNIVNLILNGLIIWYLGFYEPAKSYFK